MAKSLMSFLELLLGKKKWLRVGHVRLNVEYHAIIIHYDFVKFLKALWLEQVDITDSLPQAPQARKKWAPPHQAPGNQLPRLPHPLLQELLANPIRRRLLLGMPKRHEHTSSLLWSFYSFSKMGKCVTV